MEFLSSISSRTPCNYFPLHLCPKATPTATAAAAATSRQQQHEQRQQQQVDLRQILTCQTEARVKCGCSQRKKRRKLKKNEEWRTQKCCRCGCRRLFYADRTFNIEHAHNREKVKGSRQHQQHEATTAATTARTTSTGKVRICLIRISGRTR